MKKQFILCLLFLMFCTALLLAQENGSIEGTIADAATREALPGAIPSRARSEKKAADESQSMASATTGQGRLRGNRGSGKGTLRIGERDAPASRLVEVQ